METAPGRADAFSVLMVEGNKLLLVSLPNDLKQLIYFKLITMDSYFNQSLTFLYTVWNVQSFAMFCYSNCNLLCNEYIYIYIYIVPITDKRLLYKEHLISDIGLEVKYFTIRLYINMISLIYCEIFSGLHVKWCNMPSDI